MKKLVILIISLSVFSCKSLQIDNLDKQIIGVWVYTGYDNGEAKYKKRAAFDSQESGVEFKEGGQLIKRQNSGWCGTPPISYTNNKGTWKQTSDSTLTIAYQFWGGDAEEDWLITNAGKTDMRVKRLEHRTDKSGMN